MLKLDNIRLQLGDNVILDDVSIDVKRGEFIVIVGGNGAGKSSLMNVISGTLNPQKGILRINEQDMSVWPAHRRAKYIAKVSQDPQAGTIGAMTVEENMSFAFRRGESRGLLSFRSQRRRSLFQEKLSSLGMGLEKRLNDPVVGLSGGQRQALSLVLSTLAKSEVLLLDEITAALDPKTSKHIIHIANHLVRTEQKTTLMITHSLEEAIQYGDKIIILAQGRIAKIIDKGEKENLTPQQLFNEMTEVAVI